uniref:LisH domain-containing protein n=1 Tax=Parastrongyloides trichosuri TaxID=131310 RepID=A0A0N4ZUZ1_PARTI
MYLQNSSKKLSSKDGGKDYYSNNTEKIFRNLPGQQLKCSDKKENILSGFNTKNFNDTENKIFSFRKDISKNYPLEDNNKDEFNSEENIYYQKRRLRNTYVLKDSNNDNKSIHSNSSPLNFITNFKSNKVELQEEDMENDIDIYKEKLEWLKILTYYFNGQNIVSAKDFIKTFYKIHNITINSNYLDSKFKCPSFSKVIKKYFNEEFLFFNEDYTYYLSIICNIKIAITEIEDKIADIEIEKIANSITQIGEESFKNNEISSIFEEIGDIGKNMYKNIGNSQCGYEIEESVQESSSNVGKINLPSKDIGKAPFYDNMPFLLKKSTSHENSRKISSKAKYTSTNEILSETSEDSLDML